MSTSGAARSVRKGEPAGSSALAATAQTTSPHVSQRSAYAGRRITTRADHDSAAQRMVDPLPNQGFEYAPAVRNRTQTSASMYALGFETGHFGNPQAGPQGANIDHGLDFEAVGVELQARQNV